MNEQKVYLDVEESDEIGGAEEINNSKSNMAVGIGIGALVGSGLVIGIYNGVKAIKKKLQDKKTKKLVDQEEAKLVGDETESEED